MKIKKTLAMILALGMLFSFASCKKKPEPQATLRMVLTTLSDDAGMKKSYIDNKEHFSQVYAPLYGMSEADANAFLSGKGNWAVYMYNSSIINKEGVAYTFTGFNTGTMPAEGMWFCTESINGEVSVPADTTSIDFPASMIVNLDKLSVAQLYEAIPKLKMSVSYYPTPADDEAEPDKSSFKTLDIQIGTVAPEGIDQAGDDELTAVRGTFEDGTDFIDTFRSSEASYSDFGLDEAAVKKFTADDSNWECLYFMVSLENLTAYPLTAYTLDVKDNGSNGLWVSKVSINGEECGFEAGEKTELPFAVLVDPDVTGGAVPDELLKAMSLTISYSHTPTVTDSGSETLEAVKSVTVK